MLPADLQVHDANWAPFLALDYLVTAAVDVLAVCAALADHGAAWYGAPSLTGFIASSAAIRYGMRSMGLPAGKTGSALRQYRALATVLSHGFYRSRIFDSVHEPAPRNGGGAGWR